MLGPFGAPDDGRAWDDLAMSGFGIKQITQLRWRNSSNLDSLEVRGAQGPSC